MPRPDSIYSPFSKDGDRECVFFVAIMHDGLMLTTYDTEKNAIRWAGRTLKRILPEFRSASLVQVRTFECISRDCEYGHRQ